MTSVKEVRVEEPPTASALGRGTFAFTDDYSVFDWGKMPDAIPAKGASLCTMGAYSFEALEREGVPTHYRGVVDDEGAVAELETLDQPPEEMAIDLTQVPDLPYRDSAYDYETFHEAAGENYLVPLEVVFRNTVPVGSSLRDRGDPSEYGLEYEEWPEGAVDLPEPVVEFSTKFEEQDRYLSREEADRLAGAAGVDDLADLARTVNRVLTDLAERGDLRLEDGKLECLFHGGDLAVADVVGTLDENRFSYDGQQVSKEVVRQYYKRADPEWVEAVGEAKRAADQRGVADWRELCDLAPKPLPQHVRDGVRDLYAAGANAYTGQDWFAAPPLSAAVETVRNL